MKLLEKYWSTVILKCIFKNSLTARTWTGIRIVYAFIIARQSCFMTCFISLVQIYCPRYSFIGIPPNGKQFSLRFMRLANRNMMKIPSLLEILRERGIHFDKVFILKAIEKARAYHMTEYVEVLKKSLQFVVYETTKDGVEQLWCKISKLDETLLNIGLNSSE